MDSKPGSEVPGAASPRPVNQVERWFAKIEREVIARGVFTSVPDLARKLRRYINAYSTNAQPINWKYDLLPASVVANSLRQATRGLKLCS